jgi:hypothetical protein
MFPGRSKEWGSHHEKSTKGTNVQGNKTNKNGALPRPCLCLTRFFVAVFEVKPMWKKLWKEKCCNAWNTHCRLAMNMKHG